MLRVPTKTIAIVLVMIYAGFAQEAKKPAAVTPTARLAAAKTAFVKNGGGSDIPYNIVLSSMEGWGRYTLVDSPEKADIIVEVSSPAESSGMSVSSSTQKGRDKRDESTTTEHQLWLSSQAKLVVYDARNKVALWSATESAKSAFRQKQREDNLVQAGQKLMSRFRERVEPTPAQ